MLKLVRRFTFQGYATAYVAEHTIRYSSDLQPNAKPRFHLISRTAPESVEHPRLKVRSAEDADQMSDKPSTASLLALTPAEMQKRGGEREPAGPGAAASRTARLSGVTT